MSEAAGEVRLATYTVLPDDRKEIEAEAIEVKGLLEVLRTWSIVTAEDEEQAAAMMKEAHERHKKLEARRKEIIAPALDAQKTINALFKPATSGWEQVKGIAKRLLAEVATKREQERLAAMEKVAQGEAPPAVLAPPPGPPPGVAHRNELEIKIVNFDLVPREFLAVDWSALKIHAGKGLEAPPGVEFIRKTGIRVK